MEAVLDVESMAKTSTKVFILEVMGRHAGWITAATGLASQKAGQGPHILLFPEIPWNSFLSPLQMRWGPWRPYGVTFSRALRLTV